MANYASYFFFAWVPRSFSVDMRLDVSACAQAAKFAASSISVEKAVLGENETLVSFAEWTDLYKNAANGATITVAVASIGSGAGSV